MVLSEANRVGTGAAASGVHATPRTKVIVWLAALLALLVGIAHAEEFAGKVIRVADGDTITILDAAQAHHTIRLMGIDAPEKGQAFGTKSRESLSSMVAGRNVIIRWHKKDRYGRLVGQVFADSHDVGLIQIERGLAWHYKAYAREQRPEDAQAYADAEASLGPVLGVLEIDAGVFPRPGDGTGMDRAVHVGPLFKFETNASSRRSQCCCNSFHILNEFGFLNHGGQRAPISVSTRPLWDRSAR